MKYLLPSIAAVMGIPQPLILGRKPRLHCVNGQDRDRRVVGTAVLQGAAGAVLPADRDLAQAQAPGIELNSNKNVTPLQWPSDQYRKSCLTARRSSIAIGGQYRAMARVLALGFQCWNIPSPSNVSFSRYAF